MVAFLRQLQATSSTNSGFRNWGSQLSADLAAMGLVKVDDANQIAWRTVNAPTSGNTKTGYEVWQFSDTLQSTAPVFFRIDYGSGGSDNNRAGIWITVGTASNGRGTLSGSSDQNGFLCNSYSASVQTCVFSGSPSRVCLALFTSLDYAAQFVSIERTKNASGEDTDEGILYSGYGCPDGYSRYSFTTFIPFSGAVTPTNESGILTPSQGSTGVVKNDTCLYPNYHFKYGAPLNPGVNFLGYYNNDVLPGTTGTVSLYNKTKTYYFLGNNYFLRNVSRNSYDNTCLAMLYE